MNKHNLLATKNYFSGKFENHEKISGETLRDEYLIKNKGCVTCPIQCGRIVKISEKEVKGPELETITLLGSNLLIDSLETIFESLNVNGGTVRGKAAFTIFFQDLMEAISAGGSCLFTSYSVFPAYFIKNPNSSLVKFLNILIPFFGELVGFLHNHNKLMNFNLKNIVAYPYSIKLVTGYDMNIGKFIELGERSYNLERIINIRQGLQAIDDTLPKRLTEELQRSDDPNSKVKLNKMISKYYKIRGWDVNGLPKKEKLIRLGIQ